MFADPSIKGVVCIRGGYGCMRILPEIDFDLIRRNPKFFMGFSDITVLLQAITKNTGLITFHGSLAASDFNEYSEKSFLQVAKNPIENLEIFSSELDKNEKRSEHQRFVINTGKAVGELWGGNLSLLVSLIGTPYDIDWQGKLIFIEEVGEAPYRADRMLSQLILARKLQNAGGIIFGIFAGCDVDSANILPENSLTLKDVILDRMSGINVPSVYGFSFGHVENRAVFPVGMKAEFSAEEFRIRILPE
jgi:muramoyltetrapeptide carboxypeptidase